MSRDDPDSGAPADAADPVLIEATRGPAAESRYRGAACVCDAAGAVVAAWGDVDRPVFPRSAIKPVQTMALVASGAADRFALSAEELALASASHGGEPRHVEVVTAWLARLGLGVEDLECGAHAPSNAAAAAALVRAGRAPTAAHNNCSGKHAGMLAQARHLGAPTAGYVEHDHPAQRAWADLLGELGGVDLSKAPRGRDGCSIPTFAVPLRALALAAARFAGPGGLGDGLAAAAERVRAAMAAHPFLVAGSGRFDTRVIGATGGRALVKTGAEGVHFGALPGRGLGIALKIEAGVRSAAECAMAALLDHLGAFDGAAPGEVEALLRPRIVNWNGHETGVVRTAAGWPA